MSGLSDPIAATARFVAWLDGTMMALVAGEDRRLRQVIVATAALARANQTPIRAGVPGMIATPDPRLE